jgi:outer membrane protein X
MRHVIAAVALLAATPALATSESYQPIRVDVSFNLLYGAADVQEYGVGAAIEPKFNLTDQLSIGFRLEGAALIPQSVSVGSQSVSMGARAISAYLAKAEYYLTTSDVRPYVGIAAGLYDIAGAGQTVGSGGVVQQAEAFRGFGIAPQIGVNFGGFRLGATYHIITGGDRVVVTQAVGSTVPERHTMPSNYFALELGGTFGGNRIK